MIEFRILGPLEVHEGERLFPLGGRKQRALLALLLLHANEVVSADRLIDNLWGEEPPETIATMIQVYVSRLRKVLGAERIVTRPRGYLLRVEPGQLDLDRFESLAAEGGRPLPPAKWRGLPRSSARHSSSGEARRSPTLLSDATAGSSASSRALSPRTH